jgi:hypothetical protein
MLFFLHSLAPNNKKNANALAMVCLVISFPIGVSPDHQKNPPVIRLSEVKATHFPPPNSKTFHRPIATLLREHRIAKSRNSTANRYICCKPAVYSSVNRATVTPEDLCFDMTRLESVVLALAALCLTGQYQNDFPQDVSVGRQV